MSTKPRVRVTSNSLKGLDSAGAIPPQAAVDGGYVAVGRYLAGYAMTKQEVQSYTDAGLAIFSIWELNANAAADGASKGASDAQQAIVAAQALGQPEGSAIYMTCDFDASGAGQMGIVVEYFLAATETLHAAKYLAGAYAGNDVALEAAVQGCDFSWASAGWFRDGMADTTMRQFPPPFLDIGGVQCDLNQINDSWFGGWNYNGLVNVPKPDPKPQPDPKPDPIGDKVSILVNKPGTAAYYLVSLDTLEKIPVVDGTDLQEFLDLGLKKVKLSERQLSRFPTKLDVP